jgi:adenylate kinase family enzyme
MYFESNVCEVTQVLYYDVPQETMLERCMKRAETSGRSDDNAETIKTRVQNYFDQSLPVVDFYKKFGKVIHINANGSIAEVYAQTKEGVLPQVMFMLGPKASGKTSIANLMVQRTNAKLIDFTHFISSNGLEGQDDETIVTEFLKHLGSQTTPRLILENFPQNQFQAKFFLRNGCTPSNVFCLSCSKDICQERMIDLGEGHPNYVASSILSKKIKQFHDHAATLLPLLKECTNFTEISTDQQLDKSLETIYRHIEPCVINIRQGKKAGLC